MKQSEQTLSEQVREFHLVYGLPIESLPAVPEKAQLKLRLKLIAEEFCELLESSGVELDPLECNDSLYDKILHSIEYRLNGEFDMVGVADALGDIDYVVEGMRLVCGIDGKPIAHEIHRSNMSKLDEAGLPIYREDGKVCKGPFYTPPDIETELYIQGY